MINPISKENLKEMIQNREDFLLIDVRTPEEYNSGHIEEARPLPLDKFLKPENISNLPKNKKIILYCATQNRSRMAAQILSDLGYKDIYYLEGGYLNYND